MPEILDLHLFVVNLTLYDHGAITEWGWLFLLTLFGAASGGVHHA